MAHAADAAGHDSSRAIPLRCLICPKRPDFSDVSHLLTHVASKGHLAQHFKTSVRASTDTAARDALGQYNDWFRRYGIERLCANRLKSKESKKGRVKSGPDHLLPRVLIPSPPLSTTLGGADLGEHARRINAGYTSSSSFQLPQSSPTVDGSVFSESLDIPPAWAEQASLREPRLHLWLTDHERLHYAPRPVVGSPSASAATSSVPSSGVSGGKPTGPAGVGAAFPDQASFSFPLDCMISNGTTPAAAGTECGDDASEDVDAEKLDGDCQLKGVLWPGMDIFDSAPPEMKRQRNQKKDGSVIAQMQRNSAIVRPTELIFWPGGDLKKERWIYSPADSDFSEAAGGGGRAMGRKRPIPTARTPLQDVSANVSRGVTSSAAKAKVGGRAGELRRESRKTGRQTTKAMTTTTKTTRAAAAAAAAAAANTSTTTTTTTGARETSGRHGGQGGSDIHRPTAKMVSSDPTGEALEALEALEPPEKRTRRTVVSELDDFFRGLHGHPPSPSPSPSPTDASAALCGLSRAAALDPVGTDSQPPNAGQAASDRVSQPEITSFFKPLLPRRSGKENIPLRSSVAPSTRQAADKRETPTETRPCHSPPSMNIYSPPVGGQHDPVDFVGFGDASLFEYPTPGLTMSGFGGHGHQLPCVTRPGYTIDPALFTTDAGDWKVFPSTFPFDDDDNDNDDRDHRAGLPTDNDMLFRGGRR